MEGGQGWPPTRIGEKMLQKLLWMFKRRHDAVAQDDAPAIASVDTRAADKEMKGPALTLIFFLAMVASVMMLLIAATKQ